jgi:hypothetical protein
MARCRECGHENVLSLLICEHCYAFLPGTSPLGETVVEDVSQALAAQALRAQRHNQHRGRLTAGAIAIYAGDIETPVLMDGAQELLLGRFTPDKHAAPRLDLTGYGALEGGVSRLHATLRRTAARRLEILDLGSTNGTWLNATRLEPYVPSRVYSGDHLRLAHLWLTVYFAGFYNRRPFTARLPADTGVLHKP